jgi:hypothetical protein
MSPCIWALALLKSLFHPQLSATGKWAKLGASQWNWLSLHKLWFLKSIRSSEGTSVKAGNKMAKWSHMVSSSKTPDRLPSLIIMLLTSLHELCVVSHAVVIKELCVGREKLKVSFLIVKERTESKFTLRSFSSKTKFMTTLCLCTFELNHEITLEKNTKCSSWELFGMETMWSCHVVPYSLRSWPHMISPLFSSFLASIKTLTCKQNRAEYITHSLVAAHSSTVSTELQCMMRGISLKILVSFMRTWW